MKLKSLSRKLIIFVFVLSGFVTYGQGYEIKIQIDNLADSAVYLGYYFGDKQYVKDTVKLDKKGRGVFKGNEPLPTGMYFVLVPGNMVFEVIVDQVQKFGLSTKFTKDATDLTRYLKATGCPDMDVYIDYQLFMINRGEKAMGLRKRLAATKSEPEKKIFSDSLELLHNEVKAKWKDIEENHSANLVAAILKLNKEIDIPDFPRDEKGNVLDSAFQYKFYKKHYFDYFDFNDARLLRTQFFYPKIDRYYEKMLLQAPDTIIKETRMILGKASKNEEVFKFLLQSIFNKYNNSEIMGMDKVLVFFGEEYYLNGKAPWADTAWLRKLNERVMELKYNQVGNKAVELLLYKSDDTPVSLYNLDAEYTVLFFFEPSCGHCKKATPVMKKVADKFWGKGVEVLGVYTQTDKAEWEKFIKEQGLENWINVWDPHNQSGFRFYYDVRSTPSIYLLDKKKKILAKRVDVETLEKILDEEFRIKGEKKK
jgi:thiol-disulfide isomerase/thioredoxin